MGKTRDHAKEPDPARFSMRHFDGAWTCVPAAIFDLQRAQSLSRHSHKESRSRRGIGLDLRDVAPERLLNAQGGELFSAAERQ